MSVAKQLYQLLTPKQRRRYVLLQLYFVFAGFVQVAGVGSITPFVALVATPSLMHSNAFAQRAYVAFGFTSDTDALVALAFATMVVIILSNLIAAIATWAIFSFSFRLGIEIQQDLYISYLYRDYVALARTNSATLINSIQQGAARLTYMVIQPLLTLVSQAMVVLMVIVVLVAYEPSVAFSGALVVGVGYGAVFAVVRRKIALHGSQAWNVWEAKQKMLAESLGGLKAIRLAGVETRYEQRFSSMMSVGARSDAMVGMYGDLPRFIFETLVFCALLGLAVVLLRSAHPAGDIVAVLGLYAMTGYRLLPAAQSVFKCAGQIRANADVLTALLPDLAEGRKVTVQDRYVDRTSPPISGLIVMRDVSFAYPTSAEPVLRHVSLEIRPGELMMLVGPSGSGKSTLADVVLGLLRPDSGTIEVAGRPLNQITSTWRRSIGYVPQSIFILDDTIAANIAFGATESVDVEQLQRAAKLANLDDLIAELPGGYDFRVGEHGALLSGGQRQRLGIARALYHDANVLVLDEATSALDGLTEHEVMETLLRLRKTKTVIMIAHRMTTIRAGDRIVMLEDGRVSADGTFDELMSTSPEFRRIAMQGEREAEPESECEPEPVSQG